MKNFAKISFVTLIALSSAKSFAATDKSSFFDGVWSAMGFVLGYGDRAAYVKYACNGSDPGTGKECDGPPEKGLARKLTGILDDVMTAAAFTSCSEIPLTGTKTVTASGASYTLTFGTATQSIPAGWTGGGTKFERRMEFSFTNGGETIKAVVEGSCAYDKTAMVAMNMAVGSHAPGFTRPMNIFLGQKDGNTVADVYVMEKNSSGHVRGAYVFGLKIEEAAKKYSIWGSSTTYFDGSSSFGIVDTYNLVGNFQTHAVSSRVKRFVTAIAGAGSNTSYVDGTAIAALTGADDADLGTLTGFDLAAAKSTPTAGQVYSAQGCMDFDTPSTAPTSNAACTGLDFATAPTPVLDSAGKFSAKWAMQSVVAKLVQIPSL